ncbi:hypothetical protein MTO96_010927 [Rhipicephalus appendiculatus]
MMMQQIRLLLSPPPTRTRRSTQRSPEQITPSPPPAPAHPGAPLPPPGFPFPPAFLDQAPAEGGPTDMVAALQAMLAQAQGADSQKKPSKATVKRKKTGKKAEEEVEKKHRNVAGKKSEEAVKEEKGSQKQGDEVKKVDSSDEKFKSPLTQEATTPGKGPDPNAPALSLNFQSTTGLGDHMATTEDVSVVASRHCCIVYACLAIIICILVFVVALALVPALFQHVKGIFGFRNLQDLESSPSDWNDTTFSEPSTVDGAATMNPFMDIVETFGEVGVGDGRRDFELPSPEGPHNTVGFALDWLARVGPSVRATASERQYTRRSLSYFDERGLLQNRGSSQLETKHPSNVGLNMALSRHFDLPLPLADLESGGSVDASVDRSLVNGTESVYVASRVTLKSSLFGAHLPAKSLIDSYFSSYGY